MAWETNATRVATSFSQAIVRSPGPEFSRALSATGAAPDVALAARQHGAYCAALVSCGLTVTRLEPDPGFPDGVFVEDAAVIDGDRALIARPGHPTRRSEAALIAPEIASRVAAIEVMREPAVLDGGDVCEADGVFFVGLSERTNAEGAAHLQRWAKTGGKDVVTIDLPRTAELLHLKSGLAYIGDGTVVAVPALAGNHALAGLRVIGVSAEDAYAANCVRVNDRVLIASGYDAIAGALEAHGFRTLALDMSEFAKMDGGLSCLSLRF